MFCFCIIWLGWHTLVGTLVWGHYHMSLALPPCFFSPSPPCLMTPLACIWAIHGVLGSVVCVAARTLRASVPFWDRCPLLTTVWCTILWLSGLVLCLLPVLPNPLCRLKSWVAPPAPCLYSSCIMWRVCVVWQPVSAARHLGRRPACPALHQLDDRCDHFAFSVCAR